MGFSKIQDFQYILDFSILHFGFRVPDFGYLVLSSALSDIVFAPAPEKFRGARPRPTPGRRRPEKSRAEKPAPPAIGKPTEELSRIWGKLKRAPPGPEMHSPNQTDDGPPARISKCKMPKNSFNRRDYFCLHPDNHWGDRPAGGNG